MATNRRYLINAVTLGPATMTVRQLDGSDRKQLVWPLVVKPCLRWETKAVRDALDRIASASAALRGHYRFYSYTDARVGMNPSRDGLVMLEAARPDERMRCAGRTRTTATLSTAGEDWWDHPDCEPEVVYLGLDMFPPGNPAFNEMREKSLKGKVGKVQQVDDWGQAQFECDLEIQNDKSIKFVCRARLKQADDDDWQHEDTFFVLPKNFERDPSHVHIIDVVRSEHAWPVRAHIELTIDNNRL